MSTCTHPHNHAADPRSVPVALSVAESLCQRRGEQWTAPRRRTYELLVKAGGPVKAYDLISTFAQAGERLAKPPTIYRALDFLLAQGLVHRIESLNAFLACPSEDGRHAAGFLICDCCRRVKELDLGAASAALDAAATEGFLVERVVLEAHGICGDCRD